MSKPSPVPGPTGDMNRRLFLKHSLLGAAALTLPAAWCGDPYQPTAGVGVARRPASPIRVRGVVRGGGQPLAGVRVSDGLEVVRTASDGTYEMVTQGHRQFVSVSVPSGYRLPMNPTGTARFYQPIETRSEEMEASFELERSEVSDDEHTMLMLPDIQTETQWEMDRFHAESVPDLIETIRAAGDRSVFGVSCGDIMFDHLELFSEYERGVSRMGVPFFQVVGNHDLDFDGDDAASVRTFSSLFGPNYYSFDRGRVRYVVLDDVHWHGEGYFGHLDGDQLAWLQDDLSDLPDGAPVIVLAHIPVLGTGAMRGGAAGPSLGGSIANRDSLYRLLERFNAHVVSGHTHETEHNWNHGVHEHVSGTVCGAWWSGDICYDGSPNGYTVYEVNGEDVTWRYKATGQPDDHQIRAYAPGMGTETPDQFVANVWDWDPAWQVVWYEGGDRRGAMTQRLGLDPRSVLEHSGRELPTHRPWVDPIQTRHLFHASAPASAGPITVEATDRFGRVYSAAVPG